MSPGVSHNSLHTGTRTESTTSTFDGHRGRTNDGSGVFKGLTTIVFERPRRGRLSRRRRGDVRAIHRRGCTWFRECQFRGHNKTTTWPAGVARPSCYSPLSVSILLSPSFSPSAHPLFCTLTLSLFEIPTDTDRHRRICTVNRYLALPEAISVTKLPVYLFFMDFN